MGLGYRSVRRLGRERIAGRNSTVAAEAIDGGEYR